MRLIFSFGTYAIMGSIFGEIREVPNFTPLQARNNKASRKGGYCDMQRYVPIKTSLSPTIGG